MFKLYILRLCRAFLFFVCVGFISCNDHYVLLHNFNNETWEMREAITCSFVIDDSSKNYETTIFFRNSLEYPYRNIFLLFELQHNESTIKKDTLEYSITNKYGQWMGKGLGRIKNNYFMLNSFSEFHDIGHYKLIITHGMRSEKLIGVDKLGLKIK